MAYVIAAPEMMAAAAADLATIASNVSAAHMVAAARTTSVIPAAADEVSAEIASVFANHAQAFQGLAGKAAAFHDQFVQTLKSGGAAYAQTEATSAAGLLSLLSLLPPNLAEAVVLAPFLLIFSPFIGAVVFGILLTLLMHPQQLLQLLMMLRL
jgi:PE family